MVDFSYLFSFIQQPIQDSSILLGLLSLPVALFINFWWLLVFILIFSVWNKPWFKGLFGEFLVRLTLRFSLDKKVYHSFHNVRLKTPDGSTQIDHIFVSEFGVFVIETKNMKGEIWGQEKDRTWTQKIFKRTYKFQNPLRQNYKHVKALESILDIPGEKLFSVIAFVGHSEFKKELPDHVTNLQGLATYIRSKQQRILSSSQVQDTIQTIKANKLKNTFQAKRKHIRQLQSRSDSSSKQLCHKCGSEMVLRSAKKTGNKFWGCSTFPKCRATRSINHNQ